MQTVPQAFIDHVNGPVRRITYGLRMSFDKQFNTDTKFFQLDSSQLDGSDILQPSDDNPLQEWDRYAYQDIKDRVVSLEWTRELEFPNSVISGMADVVLDNHDGYFTPKSASPIAQYIRPKRPLRLLAGYNGMNLQQFVGLTEKMPTVDDRSKTASFHAIDFLSQIFTMPITTTIAMQNVRTDQVLANIFDQFGLSTDQYNLPVCRNVIPFVFFEKDVTNAGDVIRQLMQAEMGNLWLDEQGIIQLIPRIRPNLAPVCTLDDSNAVDVKVNDNTQIINTVKIHAEIREVQPYQVVHSRTKDDSNLFVVAAGQTREYEGELQDPALTIEAPAFGLGSGASWFTTAKPDGTAVTSGISVSGGELRTNTYVFSVTNTNGFDVNIDQMELWGQPAKVIDTIDYTEVDQDSIDEFDEQVIEINNNFIQSISQCDSLSVVMLDQYADYADELEITLKSNFALQLGDIVNLNVRTFTGTHRITKMDNRIAGGGTVQIITVRKTNLRDWFVLDVSELDGTDVLTP